MKLIDDSEWKKQDEFKQIKWQQKIEIVDDEQHVFWSYLCTSHIFL